MFRIKHGVQTTFGDILWDEPLPPIYEGRAECTAAIESFVFWLRSQRSGTGKRQMVHLE